MNKLPKYFVIKYKDSPLWNKYVDWINETYCKIINEKSWIPDRLLHPGQGFLGYDGNIAFKSGTNYHYGINLFSNNPTLITLEEWDECVNGFKLPETWYVVVTKENYDILVKWRFEGKPHFDFRIGCVVGKSKTKGKSWDYYEHRFGTEITFEQFKKYVLIEKGKEIIGYKVKEEFIDYACALIGDNSAKKTLLESKITLAATSSDWGKKFKHAGVLDMWFEPVYKLTLKKGDWITITGNRTHWLTTTKTNTFQIVSDEKGKFDQDYHWKINNPKTKEEGALCADYRMATKDEIEANKLTLPTINGYKGVVDREKGGYVKFGCASLSIDNLKDLLGLEKIGYSNKLIESIKLNSGVEITFEQIKQIVNYFKNI